MCIHCERKWQDKTIPMTEVILQILITLYIGIDTVFLKHLRTSPAIPTSIVRRNSGVSVQDLFEHLKRKKLEEPDGVFFAGL
jgi:hypothetical protein